MLIKNFIKPVFTGSRFESQFLPINFAGELAAYQTLLIELAKRIYLNDNPTRQRIPQGFSDVHLAIQEVGSGSPSLTLALMPNKNISPQMSTPLFDDEELYYKRAHDLIVDCIASQDARIPEGFPKEFVSYFNQIGRSLKEGEALQLTKIDNSETVYLNKDKRKKLVLTYNQHYECEVEISGFIIRAYKDRKIIHLRQKDGKKVTIPLFNNYNKISYDFFGSTRNIIHICGVGSFDYNDNLKQIIKINSLEFIKNYQMASRFDEISQLQNGWYNGEGLALNSTNFQIIASLFINNYPQCSPIPLIFPTQDGNLLLEWNINGLPTIDINISQKIASYQAFSLYNNIDFIEKNFNLTNKRDITEFFNFIRANIKAPPVTPRAKARIGT